MMPPTINLSCHYRVAILALPIFLDQPKVQLPIATMVPFMPVVTGLYLLMTIAFRRSVAKRRTLLQPRMV